jgi:hypothetical protein
MKIILFLMIALNVFASSDLKIVKPRNKVQSQVQSKKNVGYSNFDQLINQNKKINEGLGLYLEKPAVFDFTNQFDFKTGTVFRARLLNSIVSTNLESPLLVEVYAEQGLPDGSKFSCMGVTKYKRVVAACNRLIIPEIDSEYDIQVSVLNLDGSSGIKADYIYTGKEEFIAGSVASSFARGMIELQTDRIATPMGELTRNTAKNRLMNGVLNSTDDLNSMMKSEMQSREPKVYVKAGKDVLIYFHERFKL